MFTETYQPPQNCEMIDVDAAEPIQSGGGVGAPFRCEVMHKDLVHQVVFDHNGRRMATCSADMTVAVWDRFPNGKWERTAHWKVHGGPVWRVAWAHPEYGQIIATCSNDRSVHIWEEIQGDRSGKGKWAKKAYLTDSRSNVTDVKFAPRHLGLMIATASAQGKVRVYEAPDIMDLSRWSHNQEMDPFVYRGARCGCLAWSTSRLNRPLLAVGSDDPKLENTQRIVFYEFHESMRRWQMVPTLKLDLPFPVLDMAFSPNAAADYHQLAVAAQDVHIFTLTVPASAYCDDEGNPEKGEPTEYSSRKVAVLGDLYRAWRLCWNITGNTLTATSSDGTVRIWKAMFMNRWALISAMTHEDYLGENKLHTDSERKMVRAREKAKAQAEAAQ